MRQFLFKYPEVRPSEPAGYWLLVVPFALAPIFALWDQLAPHHGIVGLASGMALCVLFMLFSLSLLLLYFEPNPEQDTAHVYIKNVFYYVGWHAAWVLVVTIPILIVGHCRH